MARGTEAKQKITQKILETATPTKSDVVQVKAGDFNFEITEEEKKEVNDLIKTLNL